MAFIFTPNKPIKYSQFDYERFMEYVIENSALKNLPFIHEWKINWLTKLQKEDNAVKEYIKQHPNTNPLLMRAKQFPEQFKDWNEMFLFVYRSGHGEDFNFHFDIEKVKYFSSLEEPSKITLNSNDFYIDPDTNYGDINLQDHRLPYFTQMFTIDNPYIIIDGNKRVMARIKKGVNGFKGYEIDPEIILQSFFTGLEVWFYLLLLEIKLFTVLLYEGKSAEFIKRNSNIFMSK